MASSPRSPQPAELEISRQSRILAALSKKVIDLDELRMLAAQGVPDGAGVRSTVWKLLLGYLPKDRALWEQELAKKRSQYEAFKDEFLPNTVEVARLGDQKATVTEMQSMLRMGFLTGRR
uniref:Rab-GAP TBC domain-containing protein n=1 Tax=Aegilops tauschii subsp. strangulata TaxID=200361 RepID=A0A453G948_AEGTS